MKKTTFVFLCILVIFSCNTRKNKKNEICDSGLFLKLNGLVYTNEYIVNENIIYNIEEIKDYINIIKKLNNLKMDLITMSGGLSPEKLDIAYPCKYATSDYFLKFKNSDLLKAVKSHSSNSKDSEFESLFFSKLKRNFLEAKNDFSDYYFLNSTVEKIIIDLTIIELEMYEILFYHYPPCPS